MMNDQKSKMPDFEEITSFAGKLFRDLKKSVNEIIADYKEKRSQDNTVSDVTTAPAPRETIVTPPPVQTPQSQVKVETVIIDPPKPRPKRAAKPATVESAPKDKILPNKDSNKDNSF